MFGKSVSLLVVGAALVASTFASQADPVRIGDYDESFCPACRAFMVDQLIEVYRDLKDIVEIHINAYGWAEDWPEGEGYRFDCQHGPEECDGNQILGCADKYITDMDTKMEFTACFMGQPYNIYTPWADGEKCAQEHEVDWSVIEGCAKAVEGQIIHHEAGVEFNALDPRPVGVPEITINGVSSDAAYYDLKKVVCDTYQGPTPPACQ